MGPDFDDRRQMTPGERAIQDRLLIVLGVSLAVLVFILLLAAALITITVAPK